MRILVVEDEHKIANSIRRGLEQENYAVDIAYDGQDGFNLASSEDYDLIILDRLLPKMEGVEITEKLRSMDVHTPILILTAKGQVSDRVEGLDAGADDYLTKPFAFEELLARVRALVRRPKKSLNTVLSMEDLTLDTASFLVKRAGKEIRLSSKEFALLEFLMRHKGRTVAKDQIINNVWNYDADILPNTVEVYIGYLRGKIEKPFGNKKLIDTIRGFGYRMGKAD